ncbi:hypothetical protein EDD86DRAFT_212771 [Gorgonomyces haynaldii]|nr:hypothetical protein EDD86DRAFT_212771 [Gorgonomyces haynaldii]
MVASHEEAGTAVFLDPGSRAFLTGYDPDGNALILGDNCHRTLDKSNEIKGSSSGRCQSKKAFNRYSERLHNLVTDMHRILINNCQNYSHIYTSLESPQSQQMPSKSKGQTEDTRTLRVRWSSDGQSQVVWHSSR